MLQDIQPHVYHNEYKPAAPDGEGIILAYKERKVLLRSEAEDSTRILYPQFKELADKIPGIYENYTYLFTIDECHYYLIPEFDEALLPGYSYTEISRLRTALPMYRAFAGVTGLQLHNWYDDRRYCGHCGHPMKHGEKERMMYCESCNNIEYPKICPAVIVGVTNGNRLLVSKYAGREYKRYDLIAGFNEIGESIEDTVRREVMEEVGLHVKNIRFYKSQPWPFSDTLLMGFWCELDGDDTITLDENELSMAAWVTKEELPAETDISLTREMINVFRLS